uniref:Small ribosomal subunit protein uS8c n=1 Tax=Rhizanthella gardneri TaxID=112168 RepID=E7BKV6_RHIGD|nr:ribosomal protein S8 [Rhizanthella gardneri]ACU46603.1 ribosomal protein S8 [Rhizanthella gardneri]
MSRDIIANLITSIRNADMHPSKGRIQIVSTNITNNIVKILLQEGFIENIRKHKERQKNFLVSTLQHRKTRKRKKIILKRISRSGLRIYSNYQQIPKILGGLGVAIISTSKGIMTDREARLQRMGGEILCYIW